MTCSRLATGSVVAILVSVTLVSGQGEREGAGRAREGTDRPREGGGERRKVVREAAMPREWEAMAEELNTTPEQKAQLTEIAEAMRTALTTWDAENEGEVSELRRTADAARETGDRNALRKSWGAMRALQVARGRIEADFRKQMMDVLSPEQKETFAELKILQDREFQALLRDARPSAEQEAQLKETAKALGKALAEWDAENGEKMRALQQQIEEAQMALMPLREEREKLVARREEEIIAILTPEQRESMAIIRLQQEMLGRLSRTELTEEQTARVKVICEQAVRDAGPDIRTDRQASTDMRTQAAKKIGEQVVTEAQRAQLESAARRR